MNGIVIFGDVVRSRRDASGATAWLRALKTEFDDAIPANRRLAAFEFTQGDELQGLLAPGTDPFPLILRAGLRAGRRPMRWVVVAGDVDPGQGPATQRTGAAFLRARERLAEAGAKRIGLIAESGDAFTDAVLDDVAPLLVELLETLTDRQREVARLILVEGLRRSEAAVRLNVSRATVSVAADRAHARSIAGLARALGRLFAAGAAESAARRGEPVKVVS
ncbi:MAG TPA: sigma factor-like helix-turn-helix DNA-binding protein [Candidatus Limnocylindrales bacterium]|nr:sigma factor-like helix-turn-helix DNA-binding protein [Candidatus Limnocylindrales bacterium]